MPMDRSQHEPHIPPYSNEPLRQPPPSPPPTRSRPLPPRIHPDLKKAADACRLLGWLFIVLGPVPFFQTRFLMFSTTTWLTKAMAVASTIVLVGPGVWYV